MHLNKWKQLANFVALCKGERYRVWHLFKETRFRGSRIQGLITTKRKHVKGYALSMNL
jgi:hypothetical protein